MLGVTTFSDRICVVKFFFRNVEAIMVFTSCCLSMNRSADTNISVFFLGSQDMHAWNSQFLSSSFPEYNIICNVES